MSPTGVQWIVNAYLLTLAAFFAFGGRLSDIIGHRKLVVVGVVIFTFGSVMNGLTPTGDAAEVWFIVFRAVQGFGAALMLPAALAIVVGAYELRERGKALAIFFAITGGLTAVGPIAGGYLSEWTWRAIFWINVPSRSSPWCWWRGRRSSRSATRRRWTTAGRPRGGGHGPERARVPAGEPVGVGLGRHVGVHRGRRRAAGGLRVRRDASRDPLIRVKIFENRAFTVENVVLFLSMIAFIPVFFFASMYAQIALGESVSTAGLYLMTFFAGFAVAAQFGGRMLDSIGAKVPVVLGCVVAAVGFALGATRSPTSTSTASGTSSSSRARAWD